MKIIITDDVQFNAVCHVLDSMGYQRTGWTDIKTLIVCASDKGYYSNYTSMDNSWDEYLITLPELLKMRDDMVKEKARFNSSSFIHKH